MQALWSRAGNSQLIHISSHPASAVRLAARRSTTATPRQKLPVGNAVTLFASSLAAIASYVDSRLKDARRAQWDLVINEARAQVQATDIGQQKRLAALGFTIEEEVLERQRTDQLASFSDTLLDNNALKNQCPRIKGDSWADVFSWARSRNEARAASGFSDWIGPPLKFLQSLPPERLEEFHDEHLMLRRFHQRRDVCALIDEKNTIQFSPQRIKLLEYSIAKLVLRLLADASNVAKEVNWVDEESQSTNAASERKLALSKRSDIHATDPHTSMADAYEQSSIEQRRVEQRWDSKNGLTQDLIQNRKEYDESLTCLNAHIQFLRDSPIDARSKLFEDYDSPSSPRYVPKITNYRSKERGLDKSIHNLKTTMTYPKDFTPYITKICFNLLASTEPPNIHSFNALLVHICRINRRNIVDAVLGSIHETCIFPNGKTHAIVLNYYTRKTEPILFIEHYLRMRGYNNGFGSIFAGQSQDNAIGMKLRYRFFGSDDKTAIELARMNADVYEALIVGALKFFGAQSAMKFYRDMIEQGWQSSATTLRAILKHCISRFDWVGGAHVWDQIEATSQGACRLSYELMLDLCRACGQDAVFHRIFQRGIEEGVLPKDAKATESDGREIWRVMEFRKERIKKVQRARNRKRARTNPYPSERSVDVCQNADETI